MGAAGAHPEVSHGARAGRGGGNVRAGRLTVALVAMCSVGMTALPRTATAQDAVRLTAPGDDQTVTGVVDVVAEAPPEQTVVLDVTTDGGTTWEELTAVGSGTTWRGQWDSGTHSGRARLRARALESGQRDVVVIDVDNTAPTASLRASPAFSPNGDGRKDTAVLVVRVSEPASVVVQVAAPDGPVLRRWSVSTVDDVARVEWTGRRKGTRVADGRYVVTAVVRDGVGLHGRARTSTRVDTRAPRLWMAAPGTIDASRPLGLRYRVRDRARIRLHAALHDHSGAVRSVTVDRSSGPGILRVRPRYRNGDRLLPGGYRVHLTARDAAGNAVTVKRGLVVLRPTRGRVVTRLENTGRKVALTIDDCHFRDAWTSILDTLKRRGVTAAFFCPGDRLALYPDLGRRTVREGHTVASHGWDHANLAQQSYSGVAQRLTRDRQAWAKLGGVSAPYFRPPYGAYNATVVAAAGATSHPRVMLWDIDSRDFTRPSHSTLVCNVVCKSRPGSVILLHTLPGTARALPDILDGLERRNLQPVSLPELFRAAGRR